MENISNPSAFSRQMAKVLSTMSTFLWFYNESSYAKLAGEADINDFAIGNPHNMPLPELSKAYKKWSTPENKDWFAYKMSEPESRGVIASTLRQRFGVPFEPEDIHMTNGAFAAINVTLRLIADPGDEIIYISPPWFFYKSMIVACDANPVRVDCDRRTFDLDLDAIREAITPRTRAIIINSPNNPTGRIYPPETLQALAEILTVASQRSGRTIYLLSDESYNHIVYDNRPFHSPSEYYPATFLLYTYGKTLLAPGQRIGYIATPPGMPNREDIRQAIMGTQIVIGYAFPNALLQHALPDLELVSIDINHLQVKRDRMVSALTEMGYDLHSPEGTFYLLVRSPLADDIAFIQVLSENKILCLPGATFEMPGYFRISLTANDEMIERALPGFARAIQQVRSTAKVGNV